VTGVRWLRSLFESPGRASRADALAELDLALVDPDRHTWALIAAAEDPEAAEYGRTIGALEAWPARRWLALDAARLDEWSYGAAFEPSRGWRSAAGPGSPTLLLALAGTHRDGFLRERATRELATRGGSIAAAALAVRALDHVAQVREVARRALDLRQDAAHASVIVPILVAARQREAAAGALEDYLEGLLPETLRSLTRSHDTETRRIAIESAALTPAELVRIAATDRNTRARLAAARRALAKDERTADDLLAVRPATVRALAVSVAADELVKPRLERLLLDRSAHLRRAAQSRARALEVDAAALYRDHLPARAAILGLGESGAEDDVDRLTPLLGEQETAPTRRAAVRALGRLASRDVLLAVLPPLLEGLHPSLTREAARQLRRIGFSLAGRDLDRALSSPNVWTRQAALGIALARRGWDTPVAAMTLYNDPDESLREYARSALSSWFARKAASAGAPTNEQAARLSAALALTDLPPELERRIRFHGSL
jgi:hypothetical protein